MAGEGEIRAIPESDDDEEEEVVKKADSDEYPVVGTGTTVDPNSTASQKQQRESNDESQSMSQLQLSQDADEEEDLIRESSYNDESESILLPGLGVKRPAAGPSDDPESTPSKKKVRTSGSDDEGASFNIYGRNDDSSVNIVDEVTIGDDGNKDKSVDSSVEIINEKTSFHLPSRERLTLQRTSTSLATGSSAGSESLFSKIVTKQRQSFESPNISVSPIEGGKLSNGNGNAAAELSSGVSKRISSTPANPVDPARKRVFTKHKDKKPQKGISSEEEAEKVNHNNKKRKSPRKKEQQQQFKVPEEKFAEFVLIEKSQLQEIADSKTIPEGLKHVQILKEKSANFVSEVEKLAASPQFLSTSSCSEKSPDQTMMTKKRMSTSTDLSSNSASTAGYMGDNSSGLTSSSGSCRSRYSLNPYAQIDPHNTVPPLPGRASLRKTAAMEKVSEVETPETAKKKPAMPAPPAPPPSTSNEAQKKPPKKNKSDIREGAKVFAKFKEMTQIRYWPAEVKRNEPDDKWKVEFFDDRAVRDVKSEDLIPALALADGMAVSVLPETDGNFFDGKIDGCADNSKPDRIEYRIVYDEIEDFPLNEREQVSFLNIFLTDKQAKKIKGELGGKWSRPEVRPGDLDLNNVICEDGDKRTLRRTPRRKKGGEHVETSAADTEADSPKKDREKAARKKGGVPAKLKRRLLETSEEEESELEELKDNWKGRETLFKGIEFVITKGTRKEISDAYSTVDTEADSDDEDRDDDAEQETFSRSKIRKMLIACGGKVLEEFPGGKKPIPPSPNLYVLSDRARETMTFLLAVTYGCRRLHVNWVKDSIRLKKQQPVSSYEVQVGFSTVSMNPVEPSRHGSLNNLLKGKNLLLTSNKKSFADDWKQILTKLGASVNSRMSGKIDKKLRAIDLVIADNEYPVGVVNDAKERQIPVVNSRWIIQCLINAENVAVDAFLIEEK